MRSRKMIFVSYQTHLNIRPFTTIPLLSVNQIFVRMPVSLCGGRTALRSAPFVLLITKNVTSQKISSTCLAILRSLWPNRLSFVKSRRPIVLLALLRDAHSKSRLPESIDEIGYQRDLSVIV